MRSVVLAALAGVACESAPVPVAPVPAIVQPAQACGPDFAAVFAHVAPSVVAVVSGVLRDGGFRPKRSGTGFVWDGYGRVATNNHLIERADEIRVRTARGKVARAVLVGRDADTDLAILEVEGLGLAPLRRGSTEALRPGEWVAAVGNPYGLDQSITVGVVSALGRHELPDGAPRYADYIQTDVSINPGNSGGPLVDSSGRVIGMNAAMLHHGQGLAFATPVEMLETVVTRLIDEGRFVRGFAGLFTKAVSMGAAQRAHLEHPRGARVRGIVADGPAAAAGLKPGDIILRFGERMIQDHSVLPWLIASRRPGTEVALEIARGAERLNLKLVLGTAE